MVDEHNQALQVSKREYISLAASKSDTASEKQQELSTVRDVYFLLKSWSLYVKIAKARAQIDTMYERQRELETTSRNARMQACEHVTSLMVKNRNQWEQEKGYFMFKLGVIESKRPLHISRDEALFREDQAKLALMAIHKDIKAPVRDTLDKVGRVVETSVLERAFVAWTREVMRLKHRAEIHRINDEQEKREEEWHAERHDLVQKTYALETCFEKCCYFCRVQVEIAEMAAWIRIWRVAAVVSSESKRRLKMREMLQAEYAEMAKNKIRDMKIQLHLRDYVLMQRVSERSSALMFIVIFKEWLRVASINTRHQAINKLLDERKSMRAEHEKRIEHVRRSMAGVRLELLDRMRTSRVYSLRLRAFMSWVVLLHWGHLETQNDDLRQSYESRLDGETQARTAAEAEARRHRSAHGQRVPSTRMGVQTGIADNDDMGELFPGIPALTFGVDGDATVDLAQRLTHRHGRDVPAERMLSALRYLTRRPLTGAFLAMLTHEPSALRPRPGINYNGGILDDGWRGIEDQRSGNTVGAPVRSVEGLSLSSRSGVPQQTASDATENFFDKLMQDLGGRNLNLGSGSPPRVPPTTMVGRPTSPTGSPTYGTSFERDESPSRQAELLGRRALDKLANVRKALQEIEFQGDFPSSDWQPQTPGLPSSTSRGLGPISFDFSNLTVEQPLVGSPTRPESAQGAFAGAGRNPGLAASPLRSPTGYPTSPPTAQR
jgi:hypothetical protein